MRLLAPLLRCPASVLRVLAEVALSDTTARIDAAGNLVRHIIHGVSVIIQEFLDRFLVRRHEAVYVILVLGHVELVYVLLTTS